MIAIQLSEVAGNIHYAEGAVTAMRRQTQPISKAQVQHAINALELAVDALKSVRNQSSC